MKTTTRRGWGLLRTGRCGGFSLPELMVVTTIIGVVSTMALWNFRSQAQNFRVNQAVSTIHGRLMEARSLAVTKALSVSVYFLDNKGVVEFHVEADSDGDGKIATDEETVYEIDTSFITLSVPSGKQTFAPRGAFSSSWQATAKASSGYSRNVYLYANGLSYVL